MLGQPTLTIDFGRVTSAAVVVTDQRRVLVPDPASGAGRWPSAVFWDGQRMLAGAAAEQRAPADPGSFAHGIRLALARDEPVSVGARRLRPVELVAEFFAALRLAAQRLLGPAVLGGPIDRAVVMIPAGLGPTDPLRSQLIAAGEAAGFTAVELLPGAAAAVWAPGSPLRVGDTALVYDLGATFEAALVGVGDDLPEVLGHAALVDRPADPTAALDLTLACCRDLLNRSALDRGVDWVLPVGGGARAAGLALAIESGLGVRVARLEEPELAVVRGAAAWLPRSGPRTLPARPTGVRLVPLAFAIPGGGARLLRWLVEPRQPYGEGEPLARVRLSGGAIWELTARTGGVVGEVLVPAGGEVRSGEWLALVRPR